MASPTYAFEAASSATDNSANNNLTAVDWTAGDAVYVLIMTDDQGHTITACTNANLTFTQLTNSPTTGANSCKGYCYKAVAGTTQTNQTITVTMSASGGCLAAAYVVSGNPTNSNLQVTTSTAKTASVVRSGTDSLVMQMFGDWGAGVLSSPAPNPTTNGTLRASGTSPGNATFGVMDWTLQGAPGTSSYGITGSAGTGNMTKIAVEVQGTASSTVDKPVSDTDTFSEGTTGLARASSVIDSGTSTEGTSDLARASSVTDSGAFSEGTSALTQGYSATDSGTATEGTPALTQGYAPTDAAAATDASSLSRSSAVTDSATTTDTSVPAGALGASDSGALTDSATLATPVAATDSSAVSDASSATSATAATDSVATTDASALVAASAITDAGTVSEASDVSAGAPGGSGYEAAVEADNPVGYWRMGGTSGTIPDEMGGNALTVSGATRNVTGAISGDSAVQFDGVDDYASVPINLSSTGVVTLEMWVWWDAYATNDDLLLEFTNNWNSNNGSIIVDMNNSTGGAEAGEISIGHRQANGGYRSTFAQSALPAGGWHHLAMVFNMAGAHTVYVDGAAVTTTNRLSDDNTGLTFANSTLYLMSRAGGDLFGAGKLDEVAVYSYGLTATQVQDHYDAATSTPGGDEDHTASDSSTLSDASAATAAASVTDSGAVSDSSSLSTGTTKTANDSGTVTDSSSLVQSLPKSASDAAVMGEDSNVAASTTTPEGTLTESAVVGVVTSDSASVSDSSSVGVGVVAKTASDSAAVSEARTLGAASALTDSAAVTDRNTAMTKAVSDGVVIAEDAEGGPFNPGPTLKMPLTAVVTGFSALVEIANDNEKTVVVTDSALQALIESTNESTVEVTGNLGLVEIAPNTATVDVTPNIAAVEVG